MCNVKTKVIPVIIGTTGTISKSVRQYLSNIPGRHEIKVLQKKQPYCALHTCYGKCLKYITYFTGEIILRVAHFVDKRTAATLYNLETWLVQVYSCKYLA